MNAKLTKDSKQSGGISDKHDMNAGSGAFNQGSEQDPEYNKGTPVSDKEKATGHSLTKGGKRTGIGKANKPRNRMS